MKYNLRDLTPESMQCLIGSCNAIYESGEGNYLIIGERVEPKEFGLEEKVGKGEILIRVPKKLIDDREE